MTPELAPIAARVQALYRDAIDPIGERFAFPRAPHAGEIGGPPMVLVIGNHSSGKSTFINHLLGQDVQTTGLAPTDDAFTVLAHGDHGERDGRAVVSDPDLPLEGLGHFGPTFLSHLRRRTRPVPLLKTVNLIDTPGMIDSARGESGRGYDFAGAVRWFAERAELILMFFDPDKPGTTGETLEVFNTALGDLSHKLRVVMNKVDMFRSIEDFARAYGALCWNLAKVMARKDLPLIYTTYTPVGDDGVGALPRDEFERARQQLVDEIRDTPHRRADTMITRLAEHTARLELHARIVDAAVYDSRRLRRSAWAITIGVGLVTLAGAASTALIEPFEIRRTVFAGVAAVVITALVGVLARRGLRRGLDGVLGDLQGIFTRLYGRDLLVREHADDLTGLWTEIRARTARTLKQIGPLQFARLKRRDHRRLREVIERHIPDLRRQLTGAPPADGGDAG